jgi:hypothetical protein
MNKPIQQVIRTIVLIKQRFSHINFKSKVEIIEAYEIKKQFNYIKQKQRHKRFIELTELFELKECCPFDDETVKHVEQERLLWKLVDLEGHQNE